jgi:hypothetical protein
VEEFAALTQYPWPRARVAGENGRATWFSQVAGKLLKQQFEIRRGDMNAIVSDQKRKIVYWHRELPPLEADLMAEHTVEANSNRVPGTIAHRDELWDRCYQELRAAAEDRLAQEVARLGGDFAHVLNETIDAKHDDAAGQAWLHGRFSYMLYRRVSTPR